MLHVSQSCGNGRGRKGKGNAIIWIYVGKRDDYGVNLRDDVYEMKDDKCEKETEIEKNKRNIQQERREREREREGEGEGRRKGGRE